MGRQDPFHLRGRCDSDGRRILRRPPHLAPLLPQAGLNLPQVTRRVLFKKPVAVFTMGLKAFQDVVAVFFLREAHCPCLSVLLHLASKEP